jgi:hypothetical protein
MPLVLDAGFIGDTADYVLNQLIDTTIAKNREFVAWRAEHPTEATFADLAFLERDPTQVDRTAIEKIKVSETWLWNRPWDGEASSESHLAARERSARSWCSTFSTLPAIAQPSGAKIPGGSPELSSSNSTLTTGH